MPPSSPTDENVFSLTRQPSSALTTCESCTKFLSSHKDDARSSRGVCSYSLGTKDFNDLEWVGNACDMCMLLRDAILSLFPDIEEKLDFVRVTYSWGHVKTDGQNVKSPLLVTGVANSFGFDVFLDEREGINVESCIENVDAEKLEESVRFEFEIFALKGKSCPWPAIGYSNITPDDTLSEASFLQVQRWLWDCEEYHSCKEQPESRLPTRIIELKLIDGRGTPVVKLIDSSDVMGRYACLSHRWGNCQMLKTTQETLPLYRSEIPWDSLPRTFCEAFQYSLRLGINYIWVDSLCIIQDDLGDWQREAEQMSAIYEGAYITIAATGSASSDDGLRLSSETHPTSVVLQRPGPDGSYEIAVRRRIPHLFIDKTEMFRGSWQAFSSVERDFPLLTRAWVFQERLLSPRVLHFGIRELTWECDEAVHCECSGIKFDDDRVHFKLSHGRECLSAARPSRAKHFADSWYRRVHEYTQLNMTLEKDIFPALSGIAKRTQGVAQTQYVAGLWEDDLIYGLLWETYDPMAGRPKAWRAPTWSWASIRGGVDYSVSAFRTFCRDISASVTPASGDPYGELEAAILSIEAQIVPGTLWYSFDKVSKQKLGRRTEATRKLAPSDGYPSLTGFSVQHSQYADSTWKLLPDYDFSADGANHIAPGDTVFCMRMAWTGREQVLLALRLSPSVPGNFERIGLCRGGKMWSSDADYGFADVEFQRVTIL